MSDSRKIVIIDDDKEQRVLVQRKLQVQFPKNSIEFIAFENERAFFLNSVAADFYILDYEMPGFLNGVQIIHKYGLKNAALFTGNKRALSSEEHAFLLQNSIPVFEKPRDLSLLKEHISKYLHVKETSCVA